MSGLVWLPVGAFSVLGLVLAANAVDTAIYAHGLLLVVACVLAGFAILKNGEKIVAGRWQIELVARRGDRQVYKIVHETAYTP